MELWNATKLAFKNFSTFTGQTSRADYWYFVLVLVIASTAFSILDDQLATVFNVVTLLPLISASSRRLRDAGLTAHQFWWLLLPFAGLIVFIVQLGKPGVTSAK